MELKNKVTKLKKASGDIVQYREQGDLAFQLLVKFQLMTQPISIDEMMSYCLTPVPSCLGTPDGFMAKTNKAAAVHYLTRDIESNDIPRIHSGETLYIEDGNAHFQTLKDVQPTFELIGLQLLDRLVNKPDVIFSTDSYH